MTESPPTRPSLFVRIRDAADKDAWQQFVALYTPLVYGLARRRGLQEADAADLTQDVFQAVGTAVKGLAYDPSRGSFRGWLFTLTRNRLYDFLNRRRRQCQGTGDTGTVTLLEDQPDREDDQAFWEKEYEREALAWAAKQVQPQVKESTWQAFWKVAVEGKSGEVVARELGMSLGAVYVAKNRVLGRLKKLISALEAA